MAASDLVSRIRTADIQIDQGTLNIDGQRARLQF